MSKSHVEISNARTKEQVGIMEQIIVDGECPFCLKNFFRYHTNPILYEGEYWFATKNRWPYDNSKEHILIVCKTHKEKISDLNSEEWFEINTMVSYFEENGIDGGGFGMRFGNPISSGATIKHLHYHIMQPEEGKSVKFYIGTRPPKKSFFQKIIYIIKEWKKL